MKSKLFKCEGYETKKFELKKIIFYHTPKCAGTTFANIISKMIENSLRISGPLTPLSGFKKNEDVQKTSSDFYEENKSTIEKIQPQFIFGHIPVEIGKKFKNRKSVAILRDPLSRAISHFNFKIERNKSFYNEDIKFFFEKKIIPDNIMVRQFCGNLHKKNITNLDLEKAFYNLSTKIDYLFNSDQILDLINLIISKLDLPNVIFQNMQVTQNNFFINNLTNRKLIKFYNKYDFILYKRLITKKSFFNEKKNIQKRSKDNFFYYSADHSVRGKSICYIKKNEAIKILRGINQA